MTLFSKYSKQLEYLHSLGLYTTLSNYVCPLCLEEFDQTKLSELSLEDVPQRALGGYKRLLTCKRCNNTMGIKIDCHLVEYIESIERRELPVGLEHPVLIEGDNISNTINGIINVYNNRIELTIDKKRNSPSILSSIPVSLDLGTTATFLFKENIKKRLPGSIVAAIIKNGYLLLFEQFGYTFLLNQYYDIFREQILNPGLYSCVADFVLFSNSSANKDGIYIVNDKLIKGFFIQYSVSKRETYKCIVFIPLPIMDYADAIDAIRYIKINKCPLLAKMIDNYNNHLCSLEYIVNT